MYIYTYIYILFRMCVYIYILFRMCVYIDNYTHISLKTIFGFWASMYQCSGTHTAMDTLLRWCSASNCMTAAVGGFSRHPPVVALALHYSLPVGISWPCLGYIYTFIYIHIYIYINGITFFQFQGLFTSPNSSR